MLLKKTGAGPIILCSSDRRQGATINGITITGDDGCLKGIPPSTYLRIIKYYSGIT